MTPNWRGPMLSLTPSAMTDRYVHGHDIGGPLRTEPVSGHPGAIEASQRADKPNLVLEEGRGRIAHEDYWRV